MRAAWGSPSRPPRHSGENGGDDATTPRSCRDGSLRRHVHPPSRQGFSRSNSHRSSSPSIARPASSTPADSCSRALSPSPRSPSRAASRAWAISRKSTARLSGGHRAATGAGTGRCGTSGGAARGIAEHPRPVSLKSRGETALPRRVRAALQNHSLSSSTSAAPRRAFRGPREERSRAHCSRQRRSSCTFVRLRPLRREAMRRGARCVAVPRSPWR